jgi:molybdopterin synthase catalytic subunit
MSVSVQEADFDAGAEIAALSAGRDDVGAVASFVGLVRADKAAGADASGDAVHGMTLEHYPGMTEAALEDIVAEAKSRWDILAVRVIHRVGR